MSASTHRPFGHSWRYWGRRLGYAALRLSILAAIAGGVGLLIATH